MSAHAASRVDRRAQLVRAQAERLGVGHLGDRRGRIAALDGVEHVAHRQPVRDDEHGRLRPLEHLSVGA